MSKILLLKALGNLGNWQLTWSTSPFRGPRSCYYVFCTLQTLHNPPIKGRAPGPRHLPFCLLAALLWGPLVSCTLYLWVINLVLKSYLMVFAEVHPAIIVRSMRASPGATWLGQGLTTGIWPSEAPRAAPSYSVITNTAHWGGGGSPTHSSLINIWVVTKS